MLYEVITSMASSSEAAIACSSRSRFGTPDAGTFWRVIQDHKVAALFTAPTAFRAIKRDDPEGKLVGNYDISSLRTLFSYNFV